MPKRTNPGGKTNCILPFVMTPPPPLLHCLPTILIPSCTRSHSQIAYYKAYAQTQIFETNSHSQTHTHIITLTYSHSHTHTPILTLTYSNSHTHTHILNLFNLVLSIFYLLYKVKVKKSTWKIKSGAVGSVGWSEQAPDLLFQAGFCVSSLVCDLFWWWLCWLCWICWLY